MQPFSYVRASSAADAVRAFAEAGPGGPFSRRRNHAVRPDEARRGKPAPRHRRGTGLRELEVIDTSRPDELVFGALARMSDVAADPLIMRDYPALSESLWRAASQQLRNMASVGGNLLQRTRCAYFRGGEPFACNKRSPGSGCAARDGIDRGHALFGGSEDCIAVYPGDWAIALIAFDALVDIEGSAGARTVPVEALHVEPGATPHVEMTLAPGEMIVRIRVPKTALGRASTYHKIRDRESYAFALASAAAAPRAWRATWSPKPALRSAASRRGRGAYAPPRSR